MVIVQLTPDQRTMLVMMCHGKMNHLARQNPLAWRTTEYIELSQTVEELMNNCVEM